MTESVVAVHDSCHGLRELAVKEQPRRLLAEAGITVTETAGAERCCGFGGTFCVKMPAVSVAMADDKLDEWSGGGRDHGGRRRPVLPRPPRGSGPPPRASAGLPPPGRDAATMTAVEAAPVTFLSRAERDLRDDRLRAPVRNATTLMAGSRGRAGQPRGCGRAEVSRPHPAGGGAGRPARPARRVVDAARGARRPRPLGHRRGRGDGDRPGARAPRTVPRSWPRASRWPARRSTSTRCSRPTARGDRDRSRRVHHPVGRGDAVAHHRSGHPPRPLHRRRPVHGGRRPAGRGRDHGRGELREPRLRASFLPPGVGISGVNFAVADTGSICLVENEGNGRMCTSVPDVHIAIMGMERIVRDWAELDLMLGLLARSATGQALSVYTNIITGPRRQGDADGPRGTRGGARQRAVADPRHRSSRRRSTASAVAPA